MLDEGFDFWSIYQNWALCSIRVNQRCVSNHQI
jgi:hypothetical protein